MAVLNKYHFGGIVPPGAVNIMRGTAFGNPFKMGLDGDRVEVIAKYRLWLWEKIRHDTAFANRILELRGKDICCCCAPAQCHGHVLEAAANWLYTQKSAGDPTHE